MSRGSRHKVYALRLICRHPVQFREAYSGVFDQLGAERCYLVDGEHGPDVIVEVVGRRNMEAVIRYVARLADDLLSYEPPLFGKDDT